MFGALWSTSDNNFYMSMQNGSKLEKWSGWITDYYFQLQKKYDYYIHYLGLLINF